MKSCRQCQSSFEFSDVDQGFLKKLSPSFNEQKFLWPAPDLCLSCRQKKRLIWRNERSLYQQKCDLCQKSIVTVYHPEDGYTVYCHQCWWGDAWSALDYSLDFDFGRPFFDQIHDLLKVVPKVALLNLDTENCEYANFCNESRNCYLTFGAGFMEDCQYLDWVYYAKNSFDCSFCEKSELDYQNIDCSETYRSQFCQECHTISDCSYSFDLRNCKNCFGCVGLRNKEYHLFNKPLSKEQYLAYVDKLKDPKHLPSIYEEVRKLKMKHPHLAARILNSENCSGDDIENSKNCMDSFNVRDSEDCKYAYDVLQLKDCFDLNRVGISELIYNGCAGGYHHNAQFVVSSSNLNDACYVIDCIQSKNILGCVGLHRSHHAILNKQYSEEDFETLAARIASHMKETGEWGEFFPAKLSPFGYNETVAYEFFPLSEFDVVNEGFKWRAKDKQEYLPPSGDILACEVTGRNFKLTPQENQFYKEQGLPHPKRHPNQRYRDRLTLKLPRHLWDRECAQCQSAIRTPYSPDRPEVVYCEACYLKVVY